MAKMPCRNSKVMRIKIADGETISKLSLGGSQQYEPAWQRQMKWREAVRGGSINSSIMLIAELRISFPILRVSEYRP
jgi:hypothetical protein